MNRPFWITICFLGLVGIGGCFVDDAAVTCDNFADFQRECTAGCSVTWDCELYYDDLSIDDQLDLDACSDCLVDNLADGFCGDCSIRGIDSCHAFMEDLLGFECWD